MPPNRPLRSAVLVQKSDEGQVPVKLIVVQSVADYKPGGDLESLVPHVQVDLLDPGLAEQHGWTGLLRVHRTFPLQAEADAILAVYRELWANAD